eukprot:CAMPEP_0184504952 /NCGR_PEP_ID=MMETSP0113_2-20130426/52730_1 /TAXON_ID=91329 /ORGANISM="Norrisiella sphaerica, Strain BC52" /LENGTH=635 /DNA_ID=CAMNT_0026894615 /DNA_START=1006 /DNA_END=2913 /DNA_ORIENTATION=+
MKGKRFPIVTQEQGIGRGLQPLTFLADLVEKAAAGLWHTSYSSIPQYLTSKNRSLYFRHYLYSVFDFRDSSFVEVSVARNLNSLGINTGQCLEILGGILLGFSGKELVSRYTEYAGRMIPLPHWALCGGAVLGLEGGTEEVMRAYAEMKDAGTPMAALWIQDWSGYVKDDFGTRVLWNWKLNEDHYPGWDQMLSEIQKTGTRVLTYVNPYLTNKVSDQNSSLFHQAAEQGYLVRNSSGDPYVQRCGARTFTFGTIDLANPKAAEWYLSEILEKNMILGSNTSGWMADFGEYLPFDSIIGDTESNDRPVDPQYFHNRFPEEWTKLNSRVMEQQSGSKDMVFFTRAISTRSPKYARLFWAGDQMVTWDKEDGLHSALLAILSGGLSGVAMSHSDIGGYTMIERCIFGFICLYITRKCELLMRWTELSTFTDAMFRTHLGSGPGRYEAQVYSSNSSKAHFSSFARVHQSLCEYRSHLVDEAHTTGLPIARHPMLEFPSDPNLTFLESQVMLGPDIMVIPVLAPGKKSVSAYLPLLEKGESWIRWPSLAQSKTGWIQIEAPIGEPAVFFRSGFKLRHPEAHEKFVKEGAMVRAAREMGAFDCPRDMDYRLGVVELTQLAMAITFAALLPICCQKKVITQ